MTAIHVLHQAAVLGLGLKAVGNDLHVYPGRRCPPEFTKRLRTHKPRLLPLLTLPFVMVDSKALGETILFCEDEDTKGALVEAGRRAVEHLHKGRAARSRGAEPRETVSP